MNHTYPIELHAFDAANNETIMYATDSKYGDQLNIRVLEKTKPTASIISPTQGSVLGSATQDIKMELQDAGGSGLNMTSVIFKVNSVQVTQGVSWTDQGGKVRLLLLPWVAQLVTFRDVNVLQENYIAKLKGCRKAVV